MNNDFTIAMDMARKLMDSGIPFMEAVCQGLDESGTIDRWKREKAGKPRKHKVRGCFKPGDCTPPHRESI
jgi:hypothetical protein